MAGAEVFVTRVGKDNKQLCETCGFRAGPPRNMLVVYWSHNYRFKTEILCCERCDPKAVAKQQKEDRRQEESWKEYRRSTSRGKP